MTNTLRSMLEPTALSPEFPETQPNSAWESEIEASKAISLRRIADAMELVRDAYWGDAQSTGILNLIGFIEEGMRNRG